MKEESAVSNSLFKYTTDYTAKELMKYFLLAKKKVDKFEITDAADKKFTVNDGKKKYAVNLGQSLSCSCSVYKTRLMLCQHGFACIIRAKFQIEQCRLNSSYLLEIEERTQFQD